MRKSILIAEPSEESAAILREQLEDDYEISVVGNGQACLDALQAKLPDFLILEARLPDIDGYDVCRQMRTANGDSFIPTIFVSETDDPEELLAGYEAGCDDFIVKPFDRDILLSKVKLLLKYKHEHAQLSADSQQYLDAAMEALTGSGEMGVIILFLQNSYDCHDYESLARAFFEAMSNYDLTGTLMIRGKGDPFFQTSEGEPRDLENSILISAVEKGRIIELKQRAIYNGDQCSFLIRNMPLEDDAKTGRLRDHLATILVGLDARLRGLEIEQNLSGHQQMIRELVDDTRQTLASIDVINKKQRADQAAVLSDLGKTIEASFIHLSLADSQETFLTKLIVEAESVSDALYESGASLDSQFESIITRLDNAVESEMELEKPDDSTSDAVGDHADDSDSGMVFF